MSYASFLQNLPEKLSQPSSVATLTSVGIHALILAALPVLPFSAAKEQTQRLVNLVELTPEEQSRTPQQFQGGSFFAPPLSTDSLQSVPLPGSTSLDSLPTPPPISTRDFSSRDRVAFRFPDLPNNLPPQGSVTLPSLTIPQTRVIPNNPPPLESSSFVLPIPFQNGGSVPPRLANPESAIAIPDANAIREDILARSRDTLARVPSDTPRRIPDLSEFGQIPQDYQANFPPRSSASPSLPEGNFGEIPSFSNNPSPEKPDGMADLSRGIEASPGFTPPRRNERRIPSGLTAFDPDAFLLEFPRETEIERGNSALGTSQQSGEVAINSPQSQEATNAPVLSSQRESLVAEIRERRELMAENLANTTPQEANRNWLNWVEAVKNVEPQTKSLVGDYPRDACLKKLEGKAVYGALVNTSGAIADVELIQSSGYGVLNEQARQTINNHNFGSLPQQTPFQVTVDFKYNEQICPSLTVGGPPEQKETTTPTTPTQAAPTAPQARPQNEPRPQPTVPTPRVVPPTPVPQAAPTPPKDKPEPQNETKPPVTVPPRVESPTPTPSQLEVPKLSEPISPEIKVPVEPSDREPVQSLPEEDAE